MNELTKKDEKEKPSVIIEGENHCLFKEENTYRLFLGAFCSEDLKNLNRIINELMKAKPDENLEVFINSHGGEVYEGIRFLNIFETFFQKRVTTYLDNFGFSMGASVFCFGVQRIAYPYSTIMFHDYSTGAFGKFNDIHETLSFSRKHLYTFFYDHIVSKKFITAKEMKDILRGRDLYLDTEEMCKRKICTHVRYKGELLSSKEYLNILKEKPKALLAIKTNE